MVVLVVIIGVQMVPVEWWEDVVVMDWPMIEVTVVADNGAVVMDVVVVVIKVVVMGVMVEVVEGMETTKHQQWTAPDQKQGSLDGAGVAPEPAVLTATV